MVVPVINNLTQNTGYTTGGQNLTVYGFGFESDNIVATVDGKPCDVNNRQRFSFSCTVRESESVSDPEITSYVGSNGVRRSYINNNVGMNWNDLKAYESEQILSLNMEAPSDLSPPMSRQANIMESWFVAPATTRYRFYITGDDFSALSIDTDTGSVANATKRVETLGWN